MKSVSLRTNIKCDGCVSTVTPFLSKVEGLENWSVDLKDPSRVLIATVADDVSARDLQEALEAAGYTGVPLTP